MAQLYGRLQGNSGEVTRTGSACIHAQVETWQGIVRVELLRDGTYTVIVSGKHGQDRREILRGNVNARTIDFAFGEDVSQSALAEDSAVIEDGITWGGPKMTPENRYDAGAALIQGAYERGELKPEVRETFESVEDDLE